MSDRRKKAASKNIVAYTVAIVIHALIIGAMVFNFTSKPKVVEAFDADKIDVVKATTIDESQIQQQQKLIQQKDAQKKREELAEKKRLQDLKRQAEEETQRIVDLKEQQKNEQAKALELEAKRKEIALKAEQEKAKRKKEKLEAEKKLAEKKKREEAERKKKEKLAAEQKRLKEKKELEEKEARLAKEKKDRLEKEKLEQERLEKEKQEQAIKQRFADQLAAEEAKQRSTTLINKHGKLVTNAIDAKRTIAPDFSSSLVVKLNIELAEDGKVKNVSVVESSGNNRYDRDAETAVWNASPLPIPSIDDEVANKTFQNITLNIKMPGT